MTTTAKPSESAAKKDVQKLQRAIVDGLEDVKAQEIAVFNTELLSSLFERVIIASGTSNRQTKALAASVRDAVREAGFPKPRIEGEANGEWIIVDCGAAVAHIMQPAIRTYYNLEEIWGQTPVRLKFGATKPVIAVAETPAVAKKASTDGPSLHRSSAVKTAEREAKAIADAAKPPARKSSRPGAKTAPRRAPVRSSTPVSAVYASKSAIKTVAKTASTAVAKPASKPVAKPAVKAAAKPTAKVAAKAPAKVAAKVAVKAAAKAAAPAPAKAPAKAAAKAPLKVAAKPAAKAATKVPAKKATR
jgi:ribosome-associated protein